jgi:competence protein ComEA
MLKKILAASAMLFAFATFAAVDANKGTAAELDGLKGVGPAMSQRIIDARKQSAFKDWPDLMARVKGMKGKTAARLSGEGLTVNGESFKGGSAKAESKKSEMKVGAAK